MPDMPIATVVRHRKMSLEKILWGLKRADQENGRLNVRQAALTKAKNRNEIRIRRLVLACQLMMGKLDANGWNRAAFEARTGLKLPG